MTRHKLAGTTSESHWDDALDQDIGRRRFWLSYIRRYRRQVAPPRSESGSKSGDQDDFAGTEMKTTIDLHSRQYETTGATGLVLLDVSALAMADVLSFSRGRKVEGHR